MYEGQDWSADDFYAYPKSDTLAAVISEMAAVKDDVRKKNLVRMLGNKGFLDGTGVYRLNSIGMPDPAGIMLNGTFGTASTTTYTNISEVFHLEAGQSYTILVRDTDKTVDYNMTLVDKTTGAAVKQNGMGLAFNVQKSPFGTFAPDASMDVRLRINYRKEMTLEDHKPSDDAPGDGEEDFPSAEPQPDAVAFGKLKTLMNIRKEPSLEAEVVTVYPMNTIVEVLEVCDNWLKIKCPEAEDGIAYVLNEDDAYVFVGRDVYEVVAGDNLWRIAERKLGSGTHYTDIRELNSLTSNAIRIGMKLLLP